MNNKWLGIVGGFVLGITNGHAMAATLDEIIVTSTRLEETIFESPQAVSQVDRETILEKNYRTTPEALVHEPGVMVQKTAHGHGSPFIRGLTGKQVLILVDGMRLNNSTFRFGPNQYLNTIDPALIDRIEVVRGPSSVLYGSDALGGVINIITRKRQDFTQASDGDAELNLAYGSADNENTARGALQGNRSNFGYWLSGGYRDFQNLTAGGDIGEQPYTGYDEYHANASLSLQSNRRSRWDLDFQHTRQNDVPRTDKFINSNKRVVFDPQQRSAAMLRYVTRPSSSVLSRVSASLYYQDQRETLEEQKFTSTKVTRSDDQVSTVGLSVQADSPLSDRHLLSYGIEIHRDKVASSRQIFDAGVSTEAAGSYPDGSKYSMAGVYIQDEYFLSQSSSLITGLRYSYAQVNSDLSDFGFGRLQDDYRDLTASLRWSGEINRGTRLFAGVFQGFRAPNLDDVAVLKDTNEGLDVPSPGLKSEASVNYEMGLKFNQPHWQGTWVIFQTDYKDLIDRGPGTYLGLGFIDDNGNGVQDADEDNVRQKFNIGRAVIRGIELDGRLSISDNWAVFGNYSWTYGQDKTNNEPLSRIPPARVYAGLEWRRGDSYWLRPFVELMDGQDRLSARDKTDKRIPDGGTPGYVTVNLQGGWKGRKQALNVALNNLADRAYKVHGSGIYGPGRELKLSYIYYLDD